MRKIIPFVIAGILLFTTFGAVAQSNNGENHTRDVQTHKVLGEYGTATWCGYCKYAHGALKALKAGFWHDFCYVSLVDDKNTHASARRAQLGISAYPTICWDGKYKTNVGAGSIPSAMSTYNSSIIACGARTVPNINVTISGSWIGGAVMSITVVVTNNQASSYTGYLRCYVTEIISTMGWIDTAGNPYTFAFLDYAFDQSITAPASGTWSNTVTWDGALHNDGYGNTFGSIVQDNTYIIAAVFASSGGYVDDAAGYRFVSNNQPGAPSTPNPTNGATNVVLTPTVSWQCTDPDWFDTLYFDIYLEKDDTTPDILVSSHQTGKTYKPGALIPESTYYWQIIVTDELGLTTTGPIWSFTTKANNPPNTPSSPNPANGSINVPLSKTLTWAGGDPDGDTVKYDVYFGTTSPPPKVTGNQTSASYNTGTMPPLTTHYWKIVAWDSYGATTVGPLWQFTTSPPNSAPNKPVITGPSEGKNGVSYPYNINGTDPDSDLIFMYVDWGDGTNTDWQGPYASGYTLTVSHQWAEKGTYQIKAKLKDEHALEGEWHTLEVTMPMSYGLTNPVLHWLFEHFPHAFPILRHMIGY